MKFLVDAQLPPALARWLASQGHDAVHVGDIDLLSASDKKIWDYAIQSNQVILTKDEDFSIWLGMSDSSHPRVVWLRMGNIRKAELLRWFKDLLPHILSALENGERLVEVG
jgi:predicted nuclease of predicted toxin-antitoxin system